MCEKQVLLSCFLCCFFLEVNQCSSHLLIDPSHMNEIVFKRGKTKYESGFKVVMYDSYLLKDVHSVLVNFPREYAQESMMLYI